MQIQRRCSVYISSSLLLKNLERMLCFISPSKKDGPRKLSWTDFIAASCDSNFSLLHQNPYSSSFSSKYGNKTSSEFFVHDSVNHRINAASSSYRHSCKKIKLSRKTKLLSRSINQNHYEEWSKTKGERDHDYS